MNHYFLVHKPFQVLSQFSPEGSKKTLKDFFDVPSSVYPVGRLDHDSEGLLILTDDSAVHTLLLHPKRGHEREYWVQVENIINTGALAKLEHGVNINQKGKHYLTAPAKATVFKEPPKIKDRVPPIRERKNIPTSWLRLIITEGKNRQVRKMTAAVGFPTLRLIRYRIGNATIQNLEPGEMRILSQGELYNLLKLSKR